MAETGPSEVTRLLEAAGAGDEHAADRLLPVVYEALRDLAERRMAREPPGHTLQATALVHEAYLKLVDLDRVEWRNRTHFFAMAAKAIRRILIDHARTKNREKRGGDAPKLSLDEALTIPADGPDTNLIALHEALDKFAEEEPVRAQVVEPQGAAHWLVWSAQRAQQLSPFWWQRSTPQSPPSHPYGQNHPYRRRWTS